MQRAKRLYSTTAQYLEKFLKNRKDLVSSSFRGKLFELQTLYALESTAKMQLFHVGGKSDRGIDLRGTWAEMPVIIQCKNLKSGCTPEHLRGLMGTSSMLENKHISILISPVDSYTPDILSHFHPSRIPLGLASVNESILTSLMLNKAAQELLKDRVCISTAFDPLGNEKLQVEILE